MLATTTVSLSLSVDISSSRFLSEELQWAIFRILRFVIIPFISVLGISGNVTSIVILTRQGFRKCYNILLLSLAISDILLLIGVNNVVFFIYTFRYFVNFSKSISYMCYIVYTTIDYAYIAGVLSAYLIPVLITGERMLSILCPLTAHLFLTPRRTAMFMSCVLCVTATYCLYHQMLSPPLKNDTYVINGVTTALSVRSDLCRNHIRSGLFQLLANMFNYLTGIVALALNMVGCVVIGLKILHVTKRRRQLTSKANANTKRGITKTTKTLLKICFLYILCYSSAFGLAYNVENGQLQWSVIRVTVCVHNLIVCINCLGDFIIYIASNTTFLTSIVVCRRMKT
ncbi:unnamed protein product [Candidula unifasciata]|uniref:G-protein coupled receptors family 1 profile domain-containing protein n=1 Tax=Candidula unifasciata TaxID=100452 RepID=A0A8S3ZC49_9EUPU|nr:unnamed protein product [Candidula unifasciata]